jgi:hypothetical protein
MALDCDKPVVMVSSSSAAAKCSKLIWGNQSCWHARVGHEKGRQEGDESRQLGSQDTSRTK